MWAHPAIAPLEPEANLAKNQMQLHQLTGESPEEPRGGRVSTAPSLDKVVRDLDTIGGNSRNKLSRENRRPVL